MVYLKDGHKPIHYALFDIGNTLLDYNPSHIMESFGIPQERIPRMREIITDRPEWDEYDRGVLTARDIERLAIREEPTWRHEIKHYLRHWWEVFPAIVPNVQTFYRLKEAGVKTYILSNYMDDGFAYARAHNAFLNDFDGEMISYQYQVNKPDPRIYELLLEKYPEIVPDETVYFDDIKRNTDAALPFGFHAVNIPLNGPLDVYLEFED